MNTYMIPVDDKFVIEVAKAISKARLIRDTAAIVGPSLGINIDNNPKLQAQLNKEFIAMWDNESNETALLKEEALADARAAVNNINLALLTITE
jgi:hypothetical protein